MSSLPQSAVNNSPYPSSDEPSLLSAQTAPPWWQALGWLTLICGVLFFWNAWGYPLFDVDEPRYAQAAREMLQNGDWITPYFNWQLRFDKPPLHYWLIATLYQWFGITVFAARAISGLAATGIVLAVYAVGRQFGTKNLGEGHSIGWWSALITATCMEVIALAHMSITDMTLSLWMTLTTLACWLVIRHDTRWWLAAGLFSGLAMLTKGPVGIVLPGGILVVTALLSGQLRQALINRWFPIALIMAAIPFTMWFLAAWQANGDIFLNAMYHHNVSRFSGAINYHIEPWWYFIPVLVVGGLPWVLFLPSSIKKGIPSVIAPTNQRDATQQLSLFALVWCICVFGFFTVAKTKLLTYILPMFPGLGLLVGCWLTTCQVPQLSRQLQWTWGVSLILVGIAAIIGLSIAPSITPPEASHLLASLTIPILIGLLLAMLTIATLSVWNNFTPNGCNRSLTTVVSGICLITVVALSDLVPQINQLTQGDMIAFVKIANNAPLASYEITRPSLTYLTNRAIPALKRNEQQAMVDFVEQAPTTYFITKNKLSSDLLNHLPSNTTAEIKAKGAVYQLVSVSTK